MKENYVIEQIPEGNNVFALLMTEFLKNIAIFKFSVDSRMGQQIAYYLTNFQHTDEAKSTQNLIKTKNLIKS